MYLPVEHPQVAKIVPPGTAYPAYHRTAPWVSLKAPLKGWLASPLLADGSCLMLGLSPVTTELKETAPDAGMGFEGHCSAQRRGTERVFKSPSHGRH